MTPDIDVVTPFLAYTYGKYFQVSVQTWILFETIITVDRSVELFWKQPWSLPKALFLVNRYVAVFTVSIYTLHQFVMDVSAKFCLATIWLGLIGSAILISVLSLTMALRVNALWSDSRLIKSITMFLALTNILALVITGSYSWATAVVLNRLFRTVGCSMIPHVNLALNGIFIPSFIFETYVLIFTLIKVYPMVQQSGAGLPLLSLLLSDGIAYYIIIIIAQVLSFTVSFYNNATLLFPIVVISAITCNRLFIRLQGVLVAGEIVVFDVTTGFGVAGRIWTETTRGTDGDIRLLPCDERGRPIRRPVSTQWSDI